MDHPLVGVGLPIVGPLAGPDAIATIAAAAERFGYHSVSTSERLLVPAGPGWSNDFGLPDPPVYDVIEALTWVAARTERVRLFTGVAIPLFQPAIVLARRVATLDQLSRGRVDLGVGAGWLPEELVATGVPQDQRGARFEEHLAAIRACWGPDPVAFTGRWTTIPPSRIGPKPVGHVPLIIGGVAPSATARAARLGDGLIIGARDWDSTLEQIDVYRRAGGAGRLVLRAGPMLADAQHRTPPTAWTPPHVLDDLARAHAVGVDEVIWDLNIVGTPIAEQVAELERLATALDLRGAQP